MTPTSADPQRTLRLADRLAAAGRRQFVGRRAELELLCSALLASEPPFAVLHLYGPGGVGKTALLAEYARLAADAGVPALRLDGRDLDPSPPGFLLALRQALGLEEAPRRRGPRQPAARRAADRHLRGAYPARRLAARDLPAPPAGADHWSSSPGATRRPWPGAPTPAGRTSRASCRCATCRRRTAGPTCGRGACPRPGSRRCSRSPTATRWPWRWWRTCSPAAGAADLQPRSTRPTWCGRCSSASSSTSRAPRIAAPWRSARARGSRPRPCWPRAWGRPRRRALFAWLRGLSFVEQGPEGLFPHDLAREVLDADLRWRDPDAYRDLHRRVLHHLVRRLRTRTGRDQQRAYFDLLYLSRNSPLHAALLRLEGALGTAYAEPATAQDFPAILAMVHRHEGVASERIAAYWLERQPRRLPRLPQHGAGSCTGFLALLLLAEADPRDCAADPAVARPGGSSARPARCARASACGTMRFWMSREGYQDLAAVTLAAACVGDTLADHTRAGLDLSWRSPIRSSGSPTAPSSASRARPRPDFEAGGRPYGVFAHDWRVEPPLAWIERKGLLELTDGAAAVRAARRGLAGAPGGALPAGLRGGGAAGPARVHPAGCPRRQPPAPLAGRRGARRQQADPGHLQALLREAAEALRANPRDEKLYRALRRTYLEPAATQELAAELLGLPFSTYRYHLTTGIARVTAWLWRRELHGAEG